VTISGGALGVVLAIALGVSIDRWVQRAGQELFLFSPRLLAGAIVFSLALGAAAATYAALRIVRLSPAELIRRGSAA
jgi:ABC-type lipoprotein release transport system permease subunit